MARRVLVAGLADLPPREAEPAQEHGMSRKHFQAIADELRRQRPDAADKNAFDRTPWEAGTYDEWATVVIGMADVLRSFNPGFKRDRFYAACGFEA